MAKKTRRLIGLLKDEERRKVDRMKTMPSKENTEETLSVTTIILFCSGVSGGAMLTGLALLRGLDDCGSRRASSHEGYQALRRLARELSIPKVVVEGYVGLRVIGHYIQRQDALLCRILSNIV